MRAHEMACPFCGGAVGLVMVWPARWVAIALVGTLAACADRAVQTSDGSADGSSGETTNVGTTTSSTNPTMTTDVSTSGFDTGIVDTSSAVETGLSSVGFIYGDPETGEPPPIECDVWMQDCPEGEKCVPWANDGGEVWNATRCAPVEPDPDLPGEACQVEGSPFSGIDTCALGSICWNVDLGTLEGTCVAQCIGSADNPLCADADQGCVTGDDTVLNLCLDFCDPITPACAVGETCIPSGDEFYCAPDASGDEGQHGDPCEMVNGCDPGLFCASVEAVPNCRGAIGCCAEFCDATMAPDEQCTGFAEGEECVPWYAQGNAPDGLEDIGICVLPE
ncbi:MAG TPA: hypothetical protein VG755_11985 [Nannocystaceae bacterium]|nr:hypothetical protein [Nannocystaceae bacterium]